MPCGLYSWWVCKKNVVFFLSGCFKVHGLHAFLYLCVPGLHHHSVLAPLEIQLFRPLPERLNQKLSSWPTDWVITSSAWSSDPTSMGDRRFGSKNKNHFPFLGHLWSGRDFIFNLFFLRNCTLKSQLNGWEDVFLAVNKAAHFLCVPSVCCRCLQYSSVINIRSARARERAELRRSSQVKSAPGLPLEDPVPVRDFQADVFHYPATGSWQALPRFAVAVATTFFGLQRIVYSSEVYISSRNGNAEPLEELIKLTTLHLVYRL